MNFNNIEESASVDFALQDSRPKIKRLDTTMINRIAAGEVVERPLSVVKELVENSIDAGASSITVEIKDGGVAYMRITDNGSGIPKDQVLDAFAQHATSKISEPDDLGRIVTLGFRGEALSSIAAVSQVEMVTKPINDITGYRVVIHASNLVSEQEIGCADGTSVIVRNLFYNTPARLRFLKKPGTESAAVSDMISRLALGHPEISFKYINNGNMTIQTKGNGDLRTAIFHIYGKDFNKLIEIEKSSDEWTLSGLLAKPAISRANRGKQSFFINGRYVKCELIQSAVEEAYATMTMSGRFPGFVLRMQINPELVDVNVHPNKLEVRFSEETNIFSWVKDNVRRALLEENLIPEVKAKASGTFAVPVREESPFTMPLSEGATEKPPFTIPLRREATEKSPFTMPFHGRAHAGPGGDSESLTNKIYSPKSRDEMISPPIKQDILIESEESRETIEPASKHRFFTQYRIVGQFFMTYWIVEQDDSIYIIDQHAAHEKVLYEDMTRRFTARKLKSVESQKLFLPIDVSLSAAEKQLFDEKRDLFLAFGFETENTEFGVKIIALPNMFRSIANERFFLDMLDTLSSLPEEKSKGEPPTDSIADAIASAACKAAVKAKDHLDESEARALIERMLTLENPFTCPHGRPTIVEMTKYEWEKKFKRV